MSAMLEGDEEALLRPAIKWNKCFVERKRQTCGYWNCKPLLKLEAGNADGDVEEISSLSFKTVFLVSSFVVKLIRRKIQTILSDASLHTKPQGFVAVPVAVAIPEGPLLPIAILSTHGLNVPFSVDGSDFQAYAIIVPVEPGEGRHRIRHILEETRATLILCTEADGQRLASIAECCENKDKNSIQDVGSNTGIFQARRHTIVNFASVVFQAVDEVRVSKSHPKLQRCLLRMECLQSSIFECSQIISDEKEELTLGPPSNLKTNRISHLAYTSGSTGIPKGSFSSISALRSYTKAKNIQHGINRYSIVLLASALSFDPCLSDIIASFSTWATLGLATRTDLSQNLSRILKSLEISHVLCTPTLWSTMNYSEYTIGPRDFPFLKVVALGGEPIPKQIQQIWARHAETDDDERTCRLFATYGVTEACVYQTIGEITISGREGTGQNVGKPLDGMNILICSEEDQEKLVVSKNGEVGEVVLYGLQLDEWSSYLNCREQNRLKFIRESAEPSGYSVAMERCQVYYRSGDRGTVDATTGNLCILGRIGGEEGMIKVNGVRVELGEIEAALIDHVEYDDIHSECGQRFLSVVLNAAVIALRSQDTAHESQRIELIAYCVLGQSCCNELGMKDLLEENPGVLCNSQPMLSLLQARCREKVRAGCIPSAFIFVKTIPVSPTGKRHLAALPPLGQCALQESLSEETRLESYGKAGSFLAEQISSNLNLQRCQQSMLTTSASFSMLGGDSLAATRIVRALYARHYGLQDSRRLGGTYGTIDGAFSAVNLVNSKDLGAYVDFLDQNGFCDSDKDLETRFPANKTPDDAATADSATKNVSSHDSQLFDALMIATSQGYSAVAIGLLKTGANPNFGSHDGRLGKVSGRTKQKQTFTSSPLHIASLKGDVPVVFELLTKGAKYKSPDASGCFPLHLAASGESASQKQRKPDEDSRRLECVKLLLEAGAPLYMKDGTLLSIAVLQSFYQSDSSRPEIAAEPYLGNMACLTFSVCAEHAGNRQSLIQCAARAGNCALIEHILPIWKAGRGDRDFRGSSLDWRDHWSRTGIHWAVLNAHLDALRALLKHGCDPAPPSFKESTKLSSIALESPMDLCERLYGTDEGIGLEIASILREAIKQRQLPST